MARVTIPSHLQSDEFQISPEYARISMAAAIELGLKPGQFYRDCSCGCINLLQNYPEGCYANCAYCGLARNRPGLPEENSFIRVAWPLYPTTVIADRIAARERERRVGRVCLSQVQDHRSNGDLLTMIDMIHHSAPEVPIAALVNATTMDEAWLRKYRDAGVSNIGIGLDAATKAIFDLTRGRGTQGPHTWEKHWEIIHMARRLFGPMHVNCHIIVGLGETDEELFDLFHALKADGIAGYLFSFNPEPGTSMQNEPRQSIVRHRRVQLVKQLIEEYGLEPPGLEYDDQGALVSINMPGDRIDEAIRSGFPFMTDGCPDRHGVMACNRPYGSYRPGEEFRDYPFVPTDDDIRIIRDQLNLAEVCPAFAS